MVLMLVSLTPVVVADRVFGAGGQPMTRLPTALGTPALIPAGPGAEELANAPQKPAAPDADAASNPTEAMPGANPPSDVDGNFLIGPVYAHAPELTVNTNVPQGRGEQFSMDSSDSKFYPGIARNVFGTVDPNNSKTLVVETHSAPYMRTITVYIPSEYVPGAEAPFMVTHDGPGPGRVDMSLPHILDNMIAQRRLPAMVVVMIANGGGDAQGSERGLEYDTMSGKFAEFIEAEVLPLVEKNCGVKLTKDPEGARGHGRQFRRFSGIGNGVVSPGMVSPGDHLFRHLCEPTVAVQSGDAGRRLGFS